MLLIPALALPRDICWVKIRLCLYPSCREAWGVKLLFLASFIVAQSQEGRLKGDANGRWTSHATKSSTIEKFLRHSYQLVNGGT